MKKELKLCKEHYYEWMQESYPIKATEVSDKNDCDICLQHKGAINEGIMYCPRCKSDVSTYWGVCSICGYDITHPENNKDVI